MKTTNFIQLFSGIVSGVILVLLLNGCGVSTQYKPPADAPTFLDNYLLNSDLDILGTAHFDLQRPADNDSDASFFDLSWDVRSSDPYSVTVHISADANPVFNDLALGGDDQKFYEIECGSESLTYYCDFSGDQGCAIEFAPAYVMIPDPNNSSRMIRSVNPGPDGELGTGDDYYNITADHYYIRCSNTAASISEAEITDRMTAVNFPTGNLDNYIVFTVCNRSMDSCATNVTAIQVRDAGL